MTQNLLFITLTAFCVFSIVLAGPGSGGPRGHPGGPSGGGPGGHGGHGHGLPYLVNVTREARKEFEAVARNESLTIAQQDAATAALAEKYGVLVSWKGERGI